MTAVPIASRNRVNPTFMPAFLAAPQPAYFMPINEYELCRDPNCAVCRGNGQHRLQNQTQNIVSREGSSTSTVSVHSVALDERSSNISEKRLISSRKPTRDVWVSDIFHCCIRNHSKIYLSVNVSFVFLFSRLETELHPTMKSFVAVHTMVVDVLAGVVFY